jgi:DNA-binding response OmpR family regulator
LGYHIRLKANNCDTFFAADALASMTEARRNQPDLIILDLGLPAGDGFIVMEGLKTNVHLAAIPIIVVSARDQRENKHRALKAGAKAYLQKPVKDAELLAVIRQLLEETTQAKEEAVHDLGSI